MTSSRPDPGSVRLPVLLLTSLLMFLYGCNPERQSTLQSPISKEIVAIQITEADSSWNCKISGNMPLTFSASNNLEPTGLVLYFPDTRLGIAKAETPVPDNDIIAFLEAGEYRTGANADSRILIGLKVARPYRISAAVADTLISFPKVLALAAGPEGANEKRKIEPIIGPETRTATASRLQQVTVVPMKDYIIVNLVADGAIRDYRTFSIENPARIVFDLNNIHSQPSHARTIPVDSRGVKRIRYQSYPNKIRLVIDTEPQLLADYFSFATDYGLLIYVGNLPDQIRRSTAPLQ